MERILNNGVGIPALGYGTYKLPDDAVGAQAVAEAIRIGYRLIDGASAYQNEKAVGEGIKISGIPRRELFVTSKVANSQRGYDSTLTAFDNTLSDLGLDTLDLYLIHWPADKSQDEDWRKTNADTWRALERLYREKRVRAIGVSNFMPVHLKNLLLSAEIMPMVNQIEFNPGMQQPEVYYVCKQYNIIIEAWSPLARGRIFGNNLLSDIAEAHHKSIAQICLRWEIQKGTIPIPKSSNPVRMKENLDVLDFELTAGEIIAINSLATFGNSGLTPANINSH